MVVEFVNIMCSVAEVGGAKTWVNSYTLTLHALHIHKNQLSY